MVVLSCRVFQCCFFCVVFSLCIVCIFNLSSVLYFPARTNVTGTLQPSCADVPLRIYSLTHSLTWIYYLVMKLPMYCCCQGIEHEQATVTRVCQSDEVGRCTTSSVCEHCCSVLQIHNSEFICRSLQVQVNSQIISVRMLRHVHR